MEGKGSLDEELLDEVYAWIDEIQLSRPKKNISRDFSDALMAAEVIKTYISKLVSLHNYPSAHNVKQKTTNWATLNRKVLSRLGMQLSTNEIEDIVNAKHMSIEAFLIKLKPKIKEYLENPPVHKIPKPRGNSASKPNKYHQNNPNHGNYDSYENQQQFYPDDTPISSNYAINQQHKPRRMSPNLQNAGMAQLQQGQGLPHAQPEIFHLSEQTLDPARKPQLEGQLKEKDSIILDLRDTVEILELKIQKLEQLLHLKEEKIKSLAKR